MPRHTLPNGRIVSVPSAAVFDIMSSACQVLAHTGREWPTGDVTMFLDRSPDGGGDVGVNLMFCTTEAGHRSFAVMAYAKTDIYAMGDLMAVSDFLRLMRVTREEFAASLVAAPE